MYSSMRSGSIRPLFSSTIFFCRWKNGTSVGQRNRSTGTVSSEPTMAAASSGVTCWYIVSAGLPVSTATNGPWAHKPMHPTPRTRQ
jgi:hypothetical protein